MRPLRISDLVGAAAILALGTLSGCSTSALLERYPRGAFGGNQGDASELVFAPTESRLATGWEYARADDSMNIRTAAESDNPTPPEFGQLRRIYLNPRPDQIIYFEQRSPRRQW